MRPTRGHARKIVAALTLGLVSLLAGPRLQPPANPASEQPPLYLRFTGSSNVLSPAAPTASSPRTKDSPKLTNTAFQPIGTWAAAPTGSAVSLTAVSDLHVWLGLKSGDGGDDGHDHETSENNNSDGGGCGGGGDDGHDHQTNNSDGGGGDGGGCSGGGTGTSFYLHVQLARNGVVIATADTQAIKGLSTNSSKAKEVTAAFGAISDPHCNPGDVLALTLFAKLADTSGKSSEHGQSKSDSESSSSTLRVYYDATTRASRIGAAFGTTNSLPIADAGPDVNGLTPLEALNLLAELKKEME